MENKKNIIVENKKINKFSLLLNVVLTGVLLTGVFVYINSTEPEPDTHPPCRTNCPCICTDYSGSGPFNLIDGNLLNQMAIDFQHTRDAARLLTPPDKDASSVWFDLDTLKRFIWEIENRTCNCDSTLNLGVRIYYARYPELPPLTGSPFFSDLRDVPPEFALMHTVFMVPTFDEDVAGRTDHVDLDLLAITSSECRQKLPIDSGAVALMGGRNHGTLCPPICEGTAFGGD